MATTRRQKPWLPFSGSESLPSVRGVRKRVDPGSCYFRLPTETCLIITDRLTFFFSPPQVTLQKSVTSHIQFAGSRPPRQPRCSEASCRATRRSSAGRSPQHSRRMPGLPSRPSPCSRPAALSARRRPNAMLCGGPVATRPGAAVAVPRGAPLVLCGRRCWPSRPASKRSRHA